MIENDLSKIKLTDLIDVKTLQKIQDSFAKATGMAALTVDLDGPVTELSNGTDFCMNLTRACSKGAERCNKCDIDGGKEAAKTKHPSVYFCHGGLMDFASPILVGDTQIGSLIGGQVLPKVADENKFREIARDLGIDEDSYIQALSKIKVVPKESIEASAELLFIMGNTLSTIGYQKYIIKTINSNLCNISQNIFEEIAEIENHAKKVINTNATLVNSFDELLISADNSAHQVEEVDQVVKYIDAVAKQTNLLGLNASIESSKAMEYGAGFSIIAKEIRKLSAMNREQSKKIDTVLHAIKESIFSIENQIENTHSSINENAESLTHMSNTLIKLRNNAEILKDCENQLNNHN